MVFPFTLGLRKTFPLKVIPNAGRTELRQEGEILKLYLKAPPDKNKANLEPIKFFKKEYHRMQEIRKLSYFCTEMKSLLHFLCKNFTLKSRVLHPAKFFA